MSVETAVPGLVEWVRALTPAQARHLTLVVSNDSQLPSVPASIELATSVSGDDEEVPPDLLALIGSFDTAPADLRSNPRYLAERNIRHGLAPRG